jgi:hypothetical protein
MAWAVLEDIALDARIDDAGRLVADTNVRRIAENLAANKDTVGRHLARLREHGFVFQEEGRQDACGRWEPCRYVLDPSACVERFTTTPSSSPAAPDGPARPCSAAGEPADHAASEAPAPAGEAPSEAADPAPTRDGEHGLSGGWRAESCRCSPCPKCSDTDSHAVSDITGHGELGHPIRHADVKEHAARAGEPAAETGGGELADGHAGAERDEPRGAAGDAHVDAVQACHGRPVGGDGVAVAQTPAE